MMIFLPKFVDIDLRLLELIENGSGLWFYFHAQFSLLCCSCV